MPQPTVQLPRWLAALALAMFLALAAGAAFLLLQAQRLSAELARTDDTARTRDADIQRSLKRVESHILNLYKMSEGAATKAPADPPQRWHHAVIGSAAKDLTITTDSPTAGVITFRNTGESRVQDLFLTINGRRWLRSLEGAKAITESATTDRERAFLLWHYVCSRTYAWPPPDRNGPESRNAVKCLMVYGYGWSGDLSNALVQLAGAVGVRGRIRDLQGHEVPELFFDGAWRVLDPTLEAFYPDARQNGALAGVDDCALNPMLVERVTHPAGPEPATLAEYYRTEPNPEDRAAAYTAAPVGFRLAPGDEVSFFWKPIHFTHVDREMRGGDITLRPWDDDPGVIPWHSAVYAARPPYINRAVFRSEPLSSRAAAKGLTLENAVVGELGESLTRQKGTPRLAVMPAPSGGAARATFFVAVPLVITEARLSGFFLPSDKADKCVISIWAGDRLLQEVRLADGADVHTQPFSLSIGAKLSGPSAPARYGYSVRIETTLKNPAQGGVYGLRTETQCQMTSFSPWFLNHGENRIQARTVGENTQCDLFFAWHEAHSAQHFKEGPRELKTETTPEGRLNFTWTAPATSDGRPPDFYEVNLSDRADFAWPAAPGGFVEMSADMPSWTVPQVFPATAGTYFFRVRAKNAFGHPSPWSDVLTFTAQP